MLAGKRAFLGRGTGMATQRQESAHVAERQQKLGRELDEVLRGWESSNAVARDASEDERWLHENVRLVRERKLNWPQGPALCGECRMCVLPIKALCRGLLAIAQDFLRAADYSYSDQGFSVYVDAFQSVTALTMGELCACSRPALKLVVLEGAVATRPGKFWKEPDATAAHGSADYQPARSVARLRGKSCWSR